MTRKIVPVSTVVRYLKTTLDNAVGLHGVMVEGEVSNLRRPYNGHWYFSLKDEQASIACVMFAGYASKVQIPVENGDKIIITGDVTVYVAEGRMQIIVKEITRSGTGDLFLKLEALKKKLQLEGLFDDSHKKKIPAYPFDIAIVTGNQTAGRKDVLITLQKRWPSANVTEYIAPMQGAGAAPKIIEALAEADLHEHDLIILARGGGSLEDLWCFNDEALARFIYQMSTPVITGIGHETDTTLVDYVSDLRANTPTGAVEAGVPSITQVQENIQNLKYKLIYQIENKLLKERKDLDRISESTVYQHPERLYSEYVLKIDSALLHMNMLVNNRVLKKKMILDTNRKNLQLTASGAIESNRIDMIRKRENLLHLVRIHVNDEKNQLSSCIRLLDAYSPLKVMGRGYSIVTKDSAAVNHIDQIEVGDMIGIRFTDGNARAVIKEIEDE